MSTEELTEETVTDFTDAPAVPVAPEAPVAEGEEAATEADADADGSAKKGRPRDPNAQARDEAVLAALGEGYATRDELATKLGITGNLVYLSLWRLRRNEAVIKLNGKTWALPGTVLPEPEPKAPKATAEAADAEAPAES